MSCGSVGSNMQKITELFARLTEAITVSIDTRSFFGSGERRTRTVVLPSLIGRDQPVSLAVSPIVGSSAISCCRSTYNFCKLRRIEDENQVGLAGQSFRREVGRPHQHPPSLHVDQELVVHDGGFRTRLAFE